MGGSAHKYDLPHGELEFHRVFLQHDRCAARVLPRAKAPDIFAVKGYQARVRLQDPIDAAQEARLARTVWPDEADELAGIRLDACPTYDLQALRAPVDVLRSEVHAPPPPKALVLRRISQMKKGAPTSEVTTPTGNSSGATAMRARTSTHMRKMAPERMETGSTRL